MDSYYNGKSMGKWVAKYLYKIILFTSCQNLSNILTLAFIFPLSEQKWNAEALPFCLCINYNMTE